MQDPDTDPNIAKPVLQAAEDSGQHDPHTDGTKPGPEGTKDSTDFTGGSTSTGQKPKPSPEGTGDATDFSGQHDPQTD